MNKGNFDLSVIVLSYNTKEITLECLSKLKKAVSFCQKKLGNKVEVIVVDNGSADGSAKLIEEKHSWVRLIKSKTNTGFSGGNNIGMKQAPTPFILLLNSDAFVQEETLFEALQYFGDHPDCSVLGCQLKFPDGRQQPSAGFLPTPLNTILWISGLARLPLLDKFSQPIHPKDLNFFAKEQQVEWVMGAFFMLRKEVFDKTQGFDESIFTYGEEVEWCKRIKDAGFKTFYVPTFSITHLDKASSRFMLEKPLLNEIKGIVRYFHQHYSGWYLMIKPIIYLSLLMRVMIFTLLGNAQRRRAYWQALPAL